MDAYFLFFSTIELEAERIIANKLSNGDKNPVKILLKGKLSFKSDLMVVDEFPIQLQLRDKTFTCNKLEPEFEHEINYDIVPKSRGIYEFGKIHVLINSQFKLIQRKISFDKSQSVKVYPSFIQYKKYSFLALNDRLQEVGVKKIRRLGGATEFEQIREYVPGDDIRRINWKATSRRQTLLMNHYETEKSQNIYFLIDKGRMMHAPFNGMALFDYAINSTLVMAGIAQGKGDKTGLITFSNLIGSFITANGRRENINTISEALYSQETRLRESDFLRLYKNIRIRIKRRSLLMMFTNFESNTTLQRQLPYLKALAHHHVLVLVMFENAEVKNLAEKATSGVKNIYDQTTAEHHILEKARITKELAKNGIYTILTEPQNLTINTINKYLELKAKGAI